MKVSLENKILVGFILNIFLAIVFSWVSYKRIKNKNELSLLEKNHQEIILSASKSLAILNNSDNISKTYIITGEDKYLEELNINRFSIEAEVEALRVKFKNDTEQKKRIAELEKLLLKKFQNTNQYIELRKYKDFEAARDFIKDEERIQLQNNIVKKINELKSNENTEFIKNINQKSSIERILEITFYILLFCLIILLFAVYFIIRHQVKAKKGSEQLLEENHQLMQSLLDNTNNIIFIKQLNGQYLLINKQVENLFNRTKEQLIGKTDFDIFPKELADRLLAGDTDVIKAKKEMKFEEKISYKGETHNYIFVKFPIWDSEKNLYAIGLIATDISDRSNLELLLKESESEAQSIFSSAPDAIVVINDEGKIIKWNNKSESLFGWKANEVVGKPLHEIIMPSKYREQHLKGLTHFLKTGESKILNKTIEITAINKNNTEFDIDLNVSPAKLKDKYIFIAFIRDISERKILEKKVLDSQKFLNSIVENIPSLIFLKDAKEFRYVFINKSTEELTGKKRDQVIGKNAYELFSKEEADIYTNQDREVIAKRESVDIKEELATGNGKQFWLHTKKIPLMDEKGKPEFLLGISENITEQKSLEEKKKETEKLLHQNVLQMKLILENIGEGVIVIDKYGEIILSNQMAGEIVGIKEDDTVYTPVDWSKDFDLFYPNEDKIFPAQYLPLEKALLRGESTDNLEIVIQDPVTKERKYVIVNGRPILDEKNNIVAAVTTLKDITKFTELQESLKISESKNRDAIGFKMQGLKVPEVEKSLV